jgi:hypothetical protein
MITRTKIALCIAIVLGSTSATLAQSANRQPTTYARAPSQARQGSHAGDCWVPARGGAGLWREDSRGFGYWGSCSEPHARPLK